MVSVIGTMGHWFQVLRAGTLPIPTAGSIAPERCFPAASVGKEIVKDESYFSIWLNEMFLCEGRRWWVEYDPLVFILAEILAEFLYGP
jgi:hypothetical protein